MQELLEYYICGPLSIQRLSSLKIKLVRFGHVQRRDMDIYQTEHVGDGAEWLNERGRL